ncbi:integration host factor subunit beta [Propionivibrio dicarboxylicus]|uniref:integration host factor subunit beta n=1 Tax=Propionivibrio dicarboxylicus TaxID=83767 RepID=UPI000A9FD38B|nr:integration host factor subunit beta [Propionivibrio dicarboxylicus]
MTRSELIERLAWRFPSLIQLDAEASVREIVDAITQALGKGDRIEIRGFGSFSLNYRPPRNSRNPKTGTPVAVPGKWVPHFRPGKEMRARIDTTIATPTKKVA